MKRCASADRDAEVAAEGEGAHAVDQAEVDRLGGAPLLGRHELRRDAEDQRGGGPVDVVAAWKRRAASAGSSDRWASTRSSICE